MGEPTSVDHELYIPSTGHVKYGDIFKEVVSSPKVKLLSRHVDKVSNMI